MNSPKKYSFRKIDYIIICILSFFFYLTNIFGEVNFKTIFTLFIMAFLTSGLIGTLTNFLWRTKKK